MPDDPIVFAQAMSDADGSWSIQGGRVYTITLQATTIDKTIGPRAVILALGVNQGAHYRFPLVGTPTEEDFGSFLNSVQASRNAEDGRGYKVTLAYGPVNPVDQAGAQADSNTWIVNPLDAPPSVKWSSENEDVAVLVDRNGEPILNKAGDPFDPPLTRPVSTSVATITRTLAAFDPNWIPAYKNKVNRSEWMGYPAGTVMCREISGDRTYDNDWGWMWTQTLEFAFRPLVELEVGDPEKPWVTKTATLSAGWAQQVLNAGMRQLDDDGKRRAVVVSGQTVSTPVPLDEDGKYTADGDPDFEPVYLKFDIHEEADFDDFGLPEDLFSAEANSSPLGGS